MGVEIKNFSGILNTDDSPDIVNQVHHVMAVNGVFRGTPPNCRFERVRGTTEIFFNKPAGNNQCIGSVFDSVNNFIYFFYYNSNGNHSIYEYDIENNIANPIIISNTNTQGDVLGFTLDEVIYDIDILYGDNVLGNILYWLNSQKLPCKINIKTAKAGGYGTIKKSYLNVIKSPLSIPPFVAYEDDNSVTVNNLRKKLFKFKARFVYDDLEKSVTSSHSEIPLPINADDTTVDADPTKNARIAVVVQTGEPNVKKIEILAAQSLGNTFSDFFLVKVVDKATMNASSNSVFIYYFYNNEGYDYIDVQQSIQRFDYVPQKAVAQCLLKGNVVGYGNITEGYAPITDFSPTELIGGAKIGGYAAEYVKMSVTQFGESGFQNGAIKIIVVGKSANNTKFTIQTTSYSIQYTTTGAETAATILTGIAAIASGDGFTTSISGSTLTITKANEVLLFDNVVPTVVPTTPTTSFAYDWWSNIGYGFVYFDVDGRTIGVQYPSDFSVSTLPYLESSSRTQVPATQINIFHRPPEEAVYYHIVRTKNTTKSKFIQWISAQTFKDISSGTDGKQYAYISIANLNQYIKDNPNSSFLAYDFTPLDRIRFIKLFDATGADTGNIYTNKDFEIQTSVLNPTINGTDYTGQFLKILLPTTDGTFDFGTEDFSYYFIEIYTPAQSVANGLNQYYEFGERYAIGDAGLATRFHQGSIRNQTTNLSLPAQVLLVKGDNYYRQRKIYAGNELKFTLLPSLLDDNTNLNYYIGSTLDSQTVNSIGYKAQSSSTENISAPTSSSGNWFIQIQDGLAHTFRIQGTIVFQALNLTTYVFYFRVVSWNGSTPTSTYLYTSTPPTAAGTQIVINFDETFTCDAGTGNVYLFYNSLDAPIDFDARLLSGNFTITEPALTITQNIIDPNFSDNFQSAVNSNGRSWIFDPNANKVTYPVLFRWSRPYQQDTNINETNRFYPENFDEFDRAKGSIQKLSANESILDILQERACGWTGIYTKYIQDSNGASTLTTTDSIITANNVQYLAGKYGVGNQKGSFVKADTGYYFADPIKGQQVRRSQDGLTPINKLYKGQFYIRPLILPYTNTITRQQGGIAKMLGYYDRFEEEYGLVLQGGTFNGNTILPNTFTFNEQRNGYSNFYEFYPEWIITTGDKIYSWLQGSMYVHDNTTDWAKFYGSQKDTSITLVFNKDSWQKKTFQNTGYQANDQWNCPLIGDVETSLINQQTKFNQQSNILDFSIYENEGFYSAPFRFDANSIANSINGLNEGDVLKGFWIKIKFSYKGSNFAYIYLPYVNDDTSNKNINQK